LLSRFASERDEATFVELLRRYGRLVLDVCRRVLGDAHAAEDAYQATFLLLARQAGQLTGDGSLAGRILRALEALKQMATPGARQVLQGLAQGIPEARPTQEAQLVLKRLASAGH
jgi:hypothetical protein